jgi:tyrosinase
MASFDFDRLARQLAVRQSRRQTLTLAGGLGLGAAMLPHLPALAQDATPSASPAANGLRVRRNAASLSSDEKKAYTDAVLALKDKPSPWAAGLNTYDTFVLWHRDAFNCDINAAHMGAAFLPWHRQFLHLFEQQLQSVDPTVTLPYWDWTVDNTADSYVWQDDFMGGSGDPSNGYVIHTGPFAKGKWTITIFDYNDSIQNPSIIRDLGGGSMAPDLPTADQVEEALNLATYDAEPWNSTSPIAESFRNTLEGWRDCVAEMCDPVVGLGTTCTGPHDLHNRVHLWVSGEFEFAHEASMEMRSAAGAAATPDTSDPNTPEASAMILGTMAANSSPSDPVFFQHHTNIDRLWSEWMRRHGPSYLPVSGGPVGHNLNDAMWPYTQLGLTITPAMMLSSKDLGYIYDTEE